MWAYTLRRLLYNIPVYLGIILFMMLALRPYVFNPIVTRLGFDEFSANPVYAYLGKNASQEQIDALTVEMGLDRSFAQQFTSFLGDVATLDFSVRSWEQKRPVGEMIRNAIFPSLAITVPALFFTALISISIGLISSFNRGRAADRLLVIAAVMGMSVSFLVYIILGQYFGAYRLKEWLGVELFAIEGFDTEAKNWWAYYCLLPVIINVIVAMGYDTRFYRAVMVEECNRDYITTARAKGATNKKIMFVHMLKNAMIPIITRIMITLPFLITGSILLEMYFGIPGMGRTLITAINSKDFPVIQAFTAIFAALFIVTNVLTDILYAVVDPRVRLS